MTKSDISSSKYPTFKWKKLNIILFYIIKNIYFYFYWNFKKKLINYNSQKKNLKLIF